MASERAIDGGGTGAPTEDRWGTLLKRRFAPPLLTVSLGIGLFSFNQFIVSTALPSAVRDVDGSALMSWAVTVYLVPSIVSGSCAAAFKQRLSGRVALLAAALVFLAGTLVAGLAPNMAMILCGRALQGAGDGVIAALCYAMIPALFPSALIARVFGVEATIWAVSAFAGPLVSGWVTQVLSWRAAFLVNVPLILGFLALVPVVAPRDARADAATSIPIFRLSGIALGIMAVAVAAVLHGTWLRLAGLAVAAALLVWSIRADRSSDSRLFPVSMFRLSTRTGSIYWIILLMPLAQAVSGVYLVLALQLIWGFGAASAGGSCSRGSFVSSTRSSSGLRSSSSSMKEASSMFDSCRSLIACISCGVITRAWPWRITSFAESAIRSRIPRHTAAARPARLCRHGSSYHGFG